MEFTRKQIQSPYPAMQYFDDGIEPAVLDQANAKKHPIRQNIIGMTTAWVDESWQESEKEASVRGHLKYWACLLGLAISDGCAFFLSYIVFRAGMSVPSIVVFSGRAPIHTSIPIDIFQLLALAFIVVRYLSGDYRRRQLFWDGAKITTIALLITSLPDFFMLALGQGLYKPSPVILSWTCLLFTIPVLRQVARIVMLKLGIWQIPTTMIGTGSRLEETCKALKTSLALGFDVRWLVVETPDQENASLLVPGEIRRVTSSDATQTANLMWKAGCKQAIVAAEDMQSEHFSDIVQRLLEVNIPVAIIPSFTRLPLAGVTTNYFFGHNILLLQVRSNVQRLPWRAVKRMFDIVASVILLVLLLPVFIAVAIAIKRTDLGPATYSQRRIGRHGRSFPCFKFRTMVSDADECLKRWSIENPALYDEYLKTFKLKNDPRITPIGHWLRRTSLDELPQLWNVIRGDMSLVGPRPVILKELQDYYGAAAQLYVRTRPGITGLWQVSGRSDTSYEQRVILDEWYILNWSFWYDIVILIQTARIVVTGKGAF